MTNSTLRIAVVVSCLALGTFWLTRGGVLEPPGPPAPTMSTLEDLNAKLDIVLSADAPYYLIALTSTTVLPDVGLKGLNDACLTEFGPSFPGIRMCTTAEIMRTPARFWPDFTGTPAGFWAQPSPQLADGGAILDANGTEASRNGFAQYTSCSKWSSNSPALRGYTVIPEGRFNDSPCNVPQGVACCAPSNELP